MVQWFDTLRVDHFVFGSKLFQFRQYISVPDQYARIQAIHIADRRTDGRWEERQEPIVRHSFFSPLESE